MRGKYNWLNIMNKINHNEIFALYFANLRSLRRGKSMSANRCAYYALKSYYSTTTIAELVEKVEAYL